MTSLHEEIIKNLNNRLLHQAIVIDTLCGILIDSNIISEKKLKKLIDSNILATEKRIKEIEQLEKDDEIVSKIINGFTGPIGEA